MKVEAGVDCRMGSMVYRTVSYGAAKRPLKLRCSITPSLSISILTIIQPN